MVTGTLRCTKLHCRLSYVLQLYEAMESEGKKGSVSSADESKSVNQRSSSADEKKELNEDPNSNCGNSGDTKSRLSPGVRVEKVTEETKNQTEPSGQTPKNHASKLKEQIVSAEDTETTIDANNTSDDTFCSNASSSIIIEEGMDVQIISESDGEEDRTQQQSEDVQFLEEPKSPDDMFASQHPDRPTASEETQDTAGTMDCSDFIPSSQTVESLSHGVEAQSCKLDKTVGSCSPSSRKRKLESLDDVDKKLPRIDEERSIIVKTGSEDITLEAETLCKSSLETSADVTTCGKINKVVPAKNLATKESTKEASCSGNSINESVKGKSFECKSHSQDSLEKKIESVECSSTSKLGKIEHPKKRPRESLEIVFMSPTVKTSQESLGVDTQISPLQDSKKKSECPEKLTPSVEIDFKCAKDKKKDFLHSLIAPISQGKANLKENLDNTSSSQKPSSSEKSEKDEGSGDPHNSLSSCNKSVKSTNSTSKSGVENCVQGCTEILTVQEEEDNDLQILSLKQATELVVETKNDLAHTANIEHSSLSRETNSTPSDIAVVEECRTNASFLHKQNTSTSNDSVSPFSKPKEKHCSVSVIDDNYLPSSVENQCVSVKRKRESKDSDIIRIGSDSENEDQSASVLSKKSGEQNTPEDVTHLKQVTKGKRMSTPHDGSVFFSGNESISSIELDNLKELTPDIAENYALSAKDHLADTNGQTIEFEKKLYFECQVKIKCNSQNQEVISWEVAQWDDITDDLLLNSAQGVPDISPGALADVSKSTSPSSVTSSGLYTLQPRHRISTGTCSSGGTSSTGYSGASRPRSSLESVQFLKPPDRSFKDKSLSVESVLGKLSNPYNGRLKERELCGKIERRLHQGHGEMREKLGHELSDISPRNGFNQVEKEKKSLAYKSRNWPVLPVERKNLLVSETNIDISSSSEIKDANMTLNTTPKSTKKSHARPTRANRNAAKGGGTRVARQIKDDTDTKRSSKDQLKENDSCTPQKRGRLKKTNTNSKKPVSGESTFPSADTSRESKKLATISEEIKSTTSSTKSKKGRGNENEPSDSLSSSDGEVTLDWNIESCKTKLVAGAPAFARWTDKRFYSAKIKENVKDDRWSVAFDDGNVKTLKEEFIIPVNLLTKGQIVFAPVGDDFDEGVIKKFKMKRDDVLYGIEMDGGEIVYVPPSKLFMTEDQARILQEDVAPKSSLSTPKSTSVSVENIVEGKRSRSNRLLSRVVEGPGVSGTAKVTSKRSNKTDPSHDTSRSSSVSDATEKESTSAFEEVGGVDPEAYTSPVSTFSLNNRGKGPGRIKGKGRNTPRRRASSNQSNDEADLELIESLGPIPEEGSNIFSGMHFLLTYAGGDTVYYGSAGSEESAWESDAGPLRVFRKVKFVKGHLKSQLEAGGGTVYEHFKDIPSAVYPSCYLIADRPTQTAKYILCLASGIKIIHFEWVIQKCQGQELDPSGCVLPSGWSVEDRNHVYMDVKTRKKKPLSGMKIGLVNESKHFLEFWDRVLVALGAKVWMISSSEGDKEFKSVKVIVTDTSCPPEVQVRACEWNIPMVSTTWVKQCLIRWELRPYNGHQSYHYDYCQSD